MIGSEKSWLGVKIGDGESPSEDSFFIRYSSFEKFNFMFFIHHSKNSISLFFMHHSKDSKDSSVKRYKIFIFYKLCQGHVSDHSKDELKHHN